VNSILRLQRTIGNQAGQRLLRSNAEDRNAVLSGTNSPHFGHDFSQIPARPPTAGGIQTKLAINKPGDEYEQEADRVAEQVMRMPKPGFQRTCAWGGGCPKCQADLLSQPYKRLQTKRSYVENTDGTIVPSMAREVALSIAEGRQPLTDSVRSYFEPRFGYDFSHVRVHTSRTADQVTNSLNARAYTLGNHIIFGARQYAPNSLVGRRLLANELAHVVQQSSEVPKGSRPSYPDLVSLRRGLPIQIQRFCTLPTPTSAPSGTQLNPTELQRRRRAIQQAIIRSRATYPLSAANLQHWLDGSGNDRLIPQGEYDFTNPDSGVPRHLLQSHRQQIAEGIERRLNPTHPQSLQPPGTERLLTWQDSMRALPLRRGTLQPSPAMERDLSTALGGFTVSSRVRLRSLPPHGNRQDVEVLSWQVHICDRYDWIVGAAAPILIPSSVALPPIPQGAGTVRSAFGMQLVTVNDVWMAEVEQSGGARAYNIFSDILNVPANVRQNFVAVNGNVSP
jgi:hypothetical protein